MKTLVIDKELLKKVKYNLCKHIATWESEQDMREEDSLPRENQPPHIVETHQLLNDLEQILKQP